MLQPYDINSSRTNVEPAFRSPLPPPQRIHVISVLFCMWEMESEGIYSVGFRLKQLSSDH